MNRARERYKVLMMGHGPYEGAVCWACHNPIRFQSAYIVRDILGVGSVFVHWGDCPRGAGDVS